MLLRAALILIALFYTNYFAIAQSSWQIDKLGVSDGLSEGNVYVIHQDKRGFIWIGTHGGLNRYDGYGFRVFQYTPFNSSTLGDNAIFFLKEDSSTGKFWIGGSSCLNEFDPVTFTNTRYIYAKKQMEFADGVFINANELLLACENQVLLFNTRTKSFLEIPVYDENNNSIFISRVENAAVDKKGNFMIMSRTGIFFYDQSTKTCKRKTSTSPDLSAFNQYEVFNVIQDARGRYWIATNKRGVIRMDPVSGEFTAIPLPAALNNEAIRFDVLKEDSKGNIWAGSSNGLFRVDPVSLKSTYFSSDIGAAEHISHPEVNVITEDRNHMMWIGTVGGGINKLLPLNSGFRNYMLTRNDQGTKVGTYIMGLQQMENEIWFMNIWDQVGKVNMQTGKISLLTQPLHSAGYSWYSEGTILKNKSDELIVLNGESSFAIHNDNRRGLTVSSTTAHGLSHVFVDRNSKSWPMVKATVAGTSFRNDTIYGNQFFYDAIEDNTGNIWIGSSRGLIKFDKRQKSFTHFQHDDKNPNSISSDYIYGLEMDDSNQNIWMAAYNGGLCSYNISTGIFSHYTTEDGLADNTVYSIEKDHHGKFWFSSNTGISAYNPSSKTFRNYGVTDGLLNHEFNRRASYKNDAGWLFFGGISGIDYFHPDSIIETHIAPNLAFTSFRIFNNDYITDKSETIPVIELKHDDKYLSVEFASLDFKNQQKIQYAYRINDNEWIRTGNQHTLSFSDLGAGEHQLSVRSTNSEGIWLDNAISCLIIVHPAWWQTWWFRAMISALVVVFMVLAIRFYYQRKLERHKTLLEKKQAIEKERTRIATDMHDDLGAGLSRIKFLSETIGIKKQKEEAIEDEIHSIRNYSHEMIDKMGEIVWALNEKNDSLSDLLSYTRAYAVEYLSQNNLDVAVEMPENFPMTFVSGEFRRNIFLTMKEALHNVVKHGEASMVTIKIQTGKELFIGITDNGKGFNQAHIRAFSNGLTNMKKRIQEIGGDFQINGEEGTTIKFNVPLPS